MCLHVTDNTQLLLVNDDKSVLPFHASEWVALVVGPEFFQHLIECYHMILHLVQVEL